MSSDILGLLDNRWIPTANILVVVERIYHYQFKSNYLKNQSVFSRFLFYFFLFLVAALNLQCSEKEKASSVKYFWSDWPCNFCLFNCIAGFLNDNPLAVNVFRKTKNSWNLRKSIMIPCFHHSEPNQVRKSYF